MPDEEGQDKGLPPPERTGGTNPRQPESTPAEQRIDSLRESASSAATPEQVEHVLKDVAEGEEAGATLGQGAEVALDASSIEGSLRSIGSGIVESRKAKMAEYRDRLDAVNRGEELQPGDRENAQQLMSDYLSMGGTRPEAPADDNPSQVHETPPVVSGIDVSADPLAVTPAQADAGVKRILPDGAEDYGGGVIGPSAEDIESANSRDGAPPETPPTVVGTDGDAEDDEMVRLHANIEAIAKKKDAEKPGIRVGEATWRGKHYDQPVVITGDMGTDSDGRHYVAVEGYATGIPLDEIEYPAEIETTPDETQPVISPEEVDDDVDFSNPNPVGGTPSEAAPTPADEEPEPEPAATPADGTEDGDDDAESPEDPEERLRRMYERMSPERRHKRAEAIRKEISRLDSKSQRVSSLDDMEKIQDLIDRAQLDLDLVEEVQKDKNDPNAPDSKYGSIDARDEDLARKLDETMDEYRTIGESTFDQLKIKEKSEEYVIEGLEAKLKKTRGRERSLIEAKIAEAKGRLAVIQKFKAEKEGGAKDAETKSKSEEYERQQLGTASSKDIQSRIDNLSTPLADVQTEIRNIEKELADKGITEDRKKELIEKRNKLLPEAIDLQKRFDELDGAFVKAQQREADRLRPGDVGRFEPLKNISGEKWKNLTDEQRQNHLRELGKDMRNLTPAEFDNIKGMIERGEDLNVLLSARYAKELGNRLMKDGRRGYDMKALAQLKVTNPEIHAVAMDMYINSEAGKQQIKDLFPNNWQKMLKFAKGKGWLIGLLILLAGSTTVAAGKAIGKFDDSLKEYK